MTAGLVGGVVEMALSSRQGRDCTVVEVEGVLDMNGESPFRDLLQQVIDAGVRRVVVDLAGVRLMDSSGLGALVLMFQALREGGGVLCVAAPRPLVRRVFEITTVDQVISVYDAVQSAEEALSLPEG